MKAIKSIESAFAAFGLAHFIYYAYVYAERPGAIEPRELLICGAVAVAIVWIINKSAEWQENHSAFPKNWHDIICGMDVDAMGEFLLEWGLACIKGEEPENVFEWLEEEAIWTDEE